VGLGLVGTDLDRLVESALHEVELSHRMDAWPLTLSGGEAQRAGLARALVREPELLLLDEPFAALDALTRLRMQQLVGELCRRHQPAVLLVTHDVDEAVLLADRVLVLQQGRIAVERHLTMTRPRDPAHVTFAAVKRGLLQSLGVSP
jgi:sulfonate transport system ATP-binding protein